MDKEEIVKGLTNAIALLKEKEEIIRRLKKLAEHAIHTPGEQPFIISFDDGVALNEAVRLLKEQEARVMTLGEIFTAQKIDTWYETRDEDTIHPMMLVGTENSTKNQCAYFWPGIVAPIKGYGKTWRCWTARPTNDQRKDVKWE